MINQNYTSGQFRKKNVGSVILPIGAYEQHGPHGSLGTDYLIADHIASELASSTGVYKLPVIPYGCSNLHLGHAGTISINNESFKLYLDDVMRSLVMSNVRIVYLINGHGGNIKTLLNVKEHFSAEIEVVLISWWIEGRAMNLFDRDEEHHAGSLETSVTLAIDKDLVVKELYEDTIIVEYNPYEVKSIDDITPNGGIGIVTTACVKRGDEYIRQLVDRIKNEIIKSV